MRIIKSFFQSMRSTTCDGCGEDRKVCDRQCSRAAEVDREWQQAIK
jgi:hypothetical protein